MGRAASDPSVPVTPVTGASGAAEQVPTRASVLAAYLIWVVAVAMAWAAFGFGPEARRVPLAVGVPTAIVAGVSASRELRRFLRARDRSSHALEGSRQGPGMSAAGALGWLTFVTVLFAVAGFLITMVVFPALLMRLHAGEPGRSIVAVIVTVAVVSYLFLGLALDVPIHEGWLRSVLPWP